MEGILARTRRLSVVKTVVPGRVDPQRVGKNFEEISKKVGKKFGEGEKSGLSLHPLSRGTAMEDEGAQVSRAQFFSRVLMGDPGAIPVSCGLFSRLPVDTTRGREKKDEKKFPENLEGNDKTPYLCPRFPRLTGWRED